MAGWWGEVLPVGVPLPPAHEQLPPPPPPCPRLHLPSPHTHHGFHCPPLCRYLLGQPWYNNYSFGFASAVGTALQYEQCANDGARNLMQKLCSFKAKPLCKYKKIENFCELLWTSRITLKMDVFIKKHREEKFFIVNMKIIWFGSKIWK